MSSHLEKCKALLENQGYQVWKVERPASIYQPTLDMFNFGDLLSIKEDMPASFAVQCCGEDIKNHIDKFMLGYSTDKIKKNKETGEKEIVTVVTPPNPYIKTWLSGGNRLEIWGWRLRGEKGKRKTWALKKIQFFLFDGKVLHREVAEETEVEGAD